MLKEVQAIILAAGKSTRFNTGKTKLIEKVCGQELIIYPLTVLNTLEIPTTIVVGYQKDLVKETVTKYFDNVSFKEQKIPKGTGDAIKATKGTWDKKYVLIMKGDTPLITPRMIEGLYKNHLETNATISFVSAHNDNPTGFSYGRVVEKDNKTFIFRSHELSRDELQHYCCINGGIVLINRDFLETAIDQIQAKEYTNEYHMSDLVNIASNADKVVSAYTVPFDYVRGINNFQELWAAEQIKRSELIKYWMERGVRFSSAQSVHMDLDVEIGPGSIIGCGVHLLRGTKIGKNCVVSSSAMIEGSTIGDNVTVHSHTIIRHTTIHNKAEVGPFAHIQKGTVIGENAKIGNFVEIKNSTIGSHTKVKHLSYLGNAEIGSHVNVGAGTITCNYDGKKKNTTVIKDYVFIGSHTSLIAPVTVHEHSFTAAGSVITDDVPENSLAIARSRQENKEGYAEKLRCADSENNTEEDKLFFGAVKTTNETSQEV